MSVHMPWPDARVERVLGWSSIAAGAVHVAVAPAHFDEWWGYGLFFAAAAALQVVFGLVFVTDAINPRESGSGWRALRNRVLVAGGAGHAAIVALYVVTRTVGVPWFGPEAGEVEAVGVADVLATALELVVVALVAFLLRRDARA